MNMALNGSILEMKYFIHQWNEKGKWRIERKTFYLFT